jgi:hypothetical protein
MRSYRQYCSIAKALDTAGDRRFLVSVVGLDLAEHMASRG